MIRPHFLVGKGLYIIVNACVYDVLTALITDLYMDRASFKGTKGLSTKDNIPKLLDILDNCDYHSLLEFFELDS